AFASRNSFFRQKVQEPQIIEQIVEEYALKIKQAREKRKLNQEEFAKMLNERESVLHNIEAGKQKPSMELAKKLEKVLGIVLIEVIKPDEITAEKQDSPRPKGPLTIGDMLLMKK
ncbi:TIGR00270 family protein, partial [Candidatus Woesearchaeota archaeon]|nr:TIGR00270 family protein [Candidatus Woesearchaeota archaeon]